MRLILWLSSSALMLALLVLLAIRALRELLGGDILTRLQRPVEDPADG